MLTQTIMIYVVLYLVGAWLFSLLYNPAQKESNVNSGRSVGVIFTAFWPLILTVAILMAIFSDSKEKDGV